MLHLACGCQSYLITHTLISGSFTANRPGSMPLLNYHLSPSPPNLHESSAQPTHPSPKSAFLFLKQATRHETRRKPNKLTKSPAPPPSHAHNLAFPFLPPPTTGSPPPSIPSQSTASQTPSRYAHGRQSAHPPPPPLPPPYSPAPGREISPGCLQSVRQAAWRLQGGTRRRDSRRARCPSPAPFLWRKGFPFHAAVGVECGSGGS